MVFAVGNAVGDILNGVESGFALDKLPSARFSITFVSHHEVHYRLNLPASVGICEVGSMSSKDSQRILKTLTFLVSS